VADAVNGAVAVLAVAAALGRWTAEAVVHRRGGPFLRLPTDRVRLVHRVALGPLARALAHPTQAVASVADRLVPGMARAVLARIDVPDLVRDFVDLDRLAALLDVDAVVARVDIGAVLDRVDLDAIAARLDLDAVAARLDLDAVLSRLDLDAVLSRLDLDALVATVDVTRVIDRVDLDTVVERVDLDRAVDRVDIDRIIARTDVAGLARYVVEEIDLPGLLRASTGSVTDEVVRGVRDQGVGADRAVERVVDRLLHRNGRRTATGAADGRAPGSAR
jgi:hypothetical protein